MASQTDEQPEVEASRGVALRALLSSPGAACPHCGYSLEGLAKSGQTPTRCPECGGGLEAGLVRGVGPGRMRRVMVLMFAWLAFAGCMNASRRGIAVCDWYDVQRVPAVRARSVVVINGQVMTTGGTTASPVPTTWWLELAGWSVLGLLGLWGIIATLWFMSTVQRETRLVVLLVLGFIAYWGYHGFQFVIEVAARF